VARKFLWGSLALTPVVLLADYAFHASGTAIFVLAAAALVPLAWLIGETTEHVAEHTGPGIGGFVNASFGNAPELIIALFAVADGLPDVVRGSITGSVVSNLLLVLGLAVIFGGDAELDRRSTLVQLGLVGAAVAAFLVPSAPGWHGSDGRHSLYVLTLPVAVLLLALYVVVTVANLRRHRHAERPPAAREAWSLRVALVVLGVATVATALVSELLVHNLKAFEEALGLSQFVVAAVVVAIVGNAAEHGGAIVLAHRGNMRLAAEIAISSSAQVAVFVAPVIALLSWLTGDDLPLAFRPVELATMALAAGAAAAIAADGRTRRAEGVALLGAYAFVVGWYVLAGDR
jgi:Ca2+:H+ antiporter